MEPAGRALEHAERASEPAGRALEPAGRPGASWEGQLRGGGDGDRQRERKRKRTERYQYEVVQYKPYIKVSKGPSNVVSYIRLILYRGF